LPQIPPAVETKQEALRAGRGRNGSFMVKKKKQLHEVFVSLHGRSV
jgi:hypothetical protein